jgi:hypothetical protein
MPAATMVQQVQVGVAVGQAAPTPVDMATIVAAARQIVSQGEPLPVKASQGEPLPVKASQGERLPVEASREVVEDEAQRQI